MRAQLTMATRESRLALWQAHHVKQLLERQGHRVSLLGMTTLGDKIWDQPLSPIGGKGLFIKELEGALGPLLRDRLNRRRTRSKMCRWVCPRL
jgi:hydroxymethylbilane synthase